MQPWQDVGVVDFAGRRQCAPGERPSGELQLVGEVVAARGFDAHAGEQIPSREVDTQHAVAGIHTLARAEVLVERVLLRRQRIEREAAGVLVEELLQGREVERRAEPEVALEEVVRPAAAQTEVGQREGRRADVEIAVGAIL